MHLVQTHLLPSSVQREQTDETGNLQQKVEQQSHSGVKGKRFHGRHPRQRTCRNKQTEIASIKSMIDAQIRPDESTEEKAAGL